MVEEFYKFLDNEINLKKIEQWVYHNSELENIIGKGNKSNKKICRIRNPKFYY